TARWPAPCSPETRPSTPAFYPFSRPPRPGPRIHAPPRFCRFSLAANHCNKAVGDQRGLTGDERGSGLRLFRRARAREYDPYKLATPQIYLWRMIVFLILAGFIALILYQQAYTFFLSNPGLNGVIIAVLVIGILLTFRQVLRLFPEIRWVNTFRI